MLNARCSIAAASGALWIDAIGAKYLCSVNTIDLVRGSRVIP
eukprot:COSAG03_NODE_2132_length_3091_cov_29.773396_2_plen_42_part_00